MDAFGLRWFVFLLFGLIPLTTPILAEARVPALIQWCQNLLSKPKTTNAVAPVADEEEFVTVKDFVLKRLMYARERNLAVSVRHFTHGTRRTLIGHITGAHRLSNGDYRLHLVTHENAEAESLCLSHIHRVVIVEGKRAFSNSAELTAILHDLAVRGDQIVTIKMFLGRRPDIDLNLGVVEIERILDFVGTAEGVRSVRVRVARDGLSRHRIERIGIQVDNDDFEVDLAWFRDWVYVESQPPLGEDG